MSTRNHMPTFRGSILLGLLDPKDGGTTINTVCFRLHNSVCYKNYVFLWSEYRFRPALPHIPLLRSAYRRPCQTVINLHLKYVNCI